jgi:hypothetical protein
MMTTTSGRTWREAREKGIELTFPSGNVASIRPVEIDFFVRVGHVPSALTQTVSDVIDGKPFNRHIAPSQLLEDKQEWVKFLNQLATFAFVTPRVVETPEAEDEISINDISYADKLLLWVFFTRPANLLRNFRDEQEKLVAPVDVAAVNGPASQQVTENQPVGEPDHGNAGHLDGIAV